MMNLSNSGPTVMDWNVEFIDNAVVLRKGTDKRIYMLNDEHKTPFKMYFLGTFNEYKAMNLKLKYNDYIYIEFDDDYKNRLFSINNDCKINVLMKKLNIQIPQTFTNEELNKIDLSQLNDYPIYYNYIINLINNQKRKIDESEQLMNELKEYVLMNPKKDKTLLKFELEHKGFNKLITNHKIELNDYINNRRKIKTITIKKNEDINDFLKNPPTRDLQNNIKLFEYFFNRKPSDYEIQLLNVHEPYFNIRKQIKNYQFKTYSRVPGGFIKDIFFNKSKFACLLLININTRKAYAYALNNVEVHKVNQDSKGSQAEPIRGQNEEYTITYSTTNKKTTSTLINVFKQFLNDIDHKITSLRFDNESAVKSKQFQTMLRNNKIKFIPVVEGSHTSLSLIDRLCRTIRDISYNMGIKILTQNDINKVLNVYNNMYHSSLSKMLASSSLGQRVGLNKKITPNEVNDNPELEQQIINYCIDYNKQLKVLHPEIELQVGQICKVYQPFDKFKKRRRLLKKDYYKIVNKTGNIYTVQNVRNNKKIDVPRYFIYDI